MSILCHGNSHSSTPFKRTQPSTIKRLGELCQDKCPVATMEAVDIEIGDIVGQSSSGSRIRNLS